MHTRRKESGRRTIVLGFHKYMEGGGASKQASVKSEEERR